MVKQGSLQCKLYTYHMQGRLQGPVFFRGENCRMWPQQWSWCPVEGREPQGGGRWQVLGEAPATRSCPSDRAHRGTWCSHLSLQQLRMLSSVTLNCHEFRFSTVQNVINFTQVHRPCHVFVMVFVFVSVFGLWSGHVSSSLWSNVSIVISL